MAARTHVARRRAARARPATLLVDAQTEPALSPTRSDLTPLCWGAALIAGAAAVSFVGLAAIANLAVPVLAVVLAVYLLRGRRHLAYVHLIISLWMFTPGLRRIVDWQTEYHSSSPVLLAAPAASFVGVLFCAFRRTHLGRFYVFFLTGFALVLLYGLLVGALVSGPLPALVSFSTFAPPFVFGLYIAYFPGDLRKLVSQVASSSWVYLAVLGGYGVVQWLLAPAWDADWMQNVSSVTASFGEPEPFGIRVFSLLNAPFPLGCALVILIVTQVGLKMTIGRLVALPLGAAALALSSVRAAWLVLVVVLLLMAVRGRVPGRFVASAVAAVIVVLVLLPSTFTESVGDRFATLGAGSSDVSYAARDRFYATVLPDLISDVTGRGFGSTGAGVRASGNGSDSAFRDADSSYLDLLRTFGPLFTLGIVGFSLVLFLRAWLSLGKEAPPWAAWSSVLIAVPILSVLGDVYGSSNGVFLWFLLAVCTKDRGGRPVSDPARVDVTEVPA